MNHLDFILRKIAATKEDLKYTLGIWRFKDEKIVFVHGSFDLSNKETIVKLMEAAGMGTKLMVAIDRTEESKAYGLAALFFTDKIVILDEDSKADIIAYIQPEVVLTYVP